MDSPKRFVYGIYNDEHTLLHAVEHLRHEGIDVKDVVSPYPIHGMDDALGLIPTRISIASFMFGITGTSLALLMLWYMNIHDWPMDIGGKPSFALFKNIPDFIPVTFESTVFCAAHGMVITFLLRCKILPGVEPEVIDPRSTDDHFVMKVRVWEDENENDVRAKITKSGAVEVKG